MSSVRTVEDRLRAEYFALLPKMRLTLLAIETEVSHLLLPLVMDLKPYERILVRSRLKECESAVDSLKRRQEGRVFDTEKAESYSLTKLRDLVGIRVLTFPRQQARDAERVLRPYVSQWTADPVPGENAGDEPLALKYYGSRPTDPITAEIQIVPALIGLFWELEHTALYKHSFRRGEILPSVKARAAAVIGALRGFEEEFELQIRDRDVTGLDE